ncbi:hypothetical protein Taro_022728 [Colocasia esculenta]|uniref:Uncharacterized protein n=1 Tax=Colocasia esculenta TaxID=4460 RepID=A0A843V2C5_COLES|nr:hypothetical protein [Colocasia esculenta]
MALVFLSRLGITPDHLTCVHDMAKGAVVTSTRLPVPDLVPCNRYYSKSSDDPTHTNGNGLE